MATGVQVGGGRPGLALALRLAGSYGVGVMLSYAGLVSVWTALLGGLVAFMVAVPALLMAWLLLFGVAAVSNQVRGAAPRAGASAWALTVLIGGSVAAGIGADTLWTASRDAPGLHWVREPVALWAAGLGFLLVALLHVRWVRWVALAAAVLSLGTVASAGQRATDRAHVQSLAAKASGGDRGLLWLITIPGYQGYSPLSPSMSFTPTDQSTVASWRSNDIVVTVTREEMRPGDCGPTPLYAPEPWPRPAKPLPTEPVRCTAEPPGLWYRTAPNGAHEYVRTVHGVVLRAGGGPHAPRDALRAAVLGARPANDADVCRMLGGSGSPDC